jgi:hypothetical protein
MAGTSAHAALAKSKLRLPRAGVAPPALTTLGSGAPLRVNVGEDGSFQVFDADLGGAGQIYPGTSTTLGDMGVFARIGGTLYGPHFDTHADGTATAGLGTYSPWSNTSVSSVSGSGTNADPFRVTVGMDALPPNVHATLVVTYVDGDVTFEQKLRLQNLGASTVQVSAFMGADLYLAGSDTGVPVWDAIVLAVGGRGCAAPTPVALLTPASSNTDHAANDFGAIWSQIGTGQLNNVIATGCIDNAAALQWPAISLPPGASDSTICSVTFASANSTAVPWGTSHSALLLIVALAGIGLLRLRSRA